jgi:hypothetical protein
MPRPIPPPPLHEAEADLARALAENRAAAAKGQVEPYGAGTIQVLERRVQLAASVGSRTTG